MLKLLIRLEMTADDQLPSILPGTATAATANFASVYCDNISVSITSADDGQSQYTLKTECKAHVCVVGLQIECEALEITDGQLNLTKVQMVQQGQTISTDKLSMTLPVFGVTTTKFAKSLDALDATPELTNPFRGRDDRNSNWNRQAKPFTGTGFGDDLNDDWALKPGVRAFQPARPQMSSGR